jgi:hypothetical protein
MRWGHTELYLQALHEVGMNDGQRKPSATISKLFLTQHVKGIRHDMVAQ